MSGPDACSAAHVDGYRAGWAGRPCAAPAGDNETTAAWVRGWQIGRVRRDAQPVHPLPSATSARASSVAVEATPSAASSVPVSNAVSEARSGPGPLLTGAP